MFKKIQITLKVLSQIENFWTYFQVYLLPNVGKRILHFRNGVKVIVGQNKSSIGIVNEVFFYQDYFKYYKSNTPKKIIDIGANVGYFSICAKSKFPNASIYSFEPFEKSFQYLNEQISLNQFKDVHIFKKAISDETGTAELNIAGDSGENSLVSSSNSKDKIKIETLALSELFDKHNIDICDFMKVDCEGSEYKIFYNLPKQYFKKIAYIAMETHEIDKGSNNRDALAKYLEDQGFKIIKENIGACPYIFATNTFK